MTVGRPLIICCQWTAVENWTTVDYLLSVDSCWKLNATSSSASIPASASATPSQCPNQLSTQNQYQAKLQTICWLFSNNSSWLDQLYHNSTCLEVDKLDGRRNDRKKSRMVILFLGGQGGGCTSVSWAFGFLSRPTRICGAVYNSGEWGSSDVSCSCSCSPRPPTLSERGNAREFFNMGEGARKIMLGGATLRLEQAYIQTPKNTSESWKGSEIA